MATIDAFAVINGYGAVDIATIEDYDLDGHELLKITGVVWNKNRDAFNEIINPIDVQGIILKVDDPDKLYLSMYLAQYLAG